MSLEGEGTHVTKVAYCNGGYNLYSNKGRKAIFYCFDVLANTVFSLFLSSGTKYKAGRKG